MSVQGDTSKSEHALDRTPYDFPCFRDIFLKNTKIRCYNCEQLPINNNEIVTVLVEVDCQLTVNYRIIWHKHVHWEILTHIQYVIW